MRSKSGNPPTAKTKETTNVTLALNEISISLQTAQHADNFIFWQVSTAKSALPFLQAR
jgi:hypothetical protein